MKKVTINEIKADYTESGYMYQVIIRTNGRITYKLNYISLYEATIAIMEHYND